MVPYDSESKTHPLLPVELQTLLMTLLLIGLLVVTTDLSDTRWFLLFNMVIVVLILAVAYRCPVATGNRRQPVRDWYVLALLIALFFECIHLIPKINPNDKDHWLIAVDLWLFGGQHPTVLLESITRPWLTELLQWVYASFYFLPFLLCLRIYLKNNRIVFHAVAAAITLGFYISYLGYFAVPAIGPRFTLNHLQTIPLTGLMAFDTIRGILGHLEGTMRDCFPSGHTLVSALTLWLCLRHDRPMAVIVAPWSILMILSCAYLRYHYVTDIIAALLLVPPIYLFHKTLLPGGRFQISVLS